MRYINYLLSGMYSCYLETGLSDIVNFLSQLICAHHLAYIHVHLLVRPDRFCLFVCFSQMVLQTMLLNNSYFRVYYQKQRPKKNNSSWGQLEDFQIVTDFQNVGDFKT